jgi:hypothetical protein
MSVRKLEATTRLMIDGKEVASIAKSLEISASFSLRNVRQVGSQIQGDGVLTIDTGFGTVEFEMPFVIDTTVGNPVYVDLGTISLPILGEVEVVAEFSYDLPQRQLCATLTLEGLLTIGKTCVNF